MSTRQSVRKSAVGTSASMTRKSRVGPMKEPSIMDFVAKAQSVNMPLMANTRGTDHFMNFFRWSGSGNKDDDDGEDTKSTKVSLWKLLSFSTCTEKWLMALGILMAFFSGLGIPVWLALLANALDTFSNLGRLINALPDDGGLYDLLNREMLQLSVAFMIVGGIVFVAGSLYVALWTYTGEQQALRIQKEFVKAALNQDAAWFDTHNREELPTKMGTNIVHMNAAIGRSVADTFGLGVSAVGCLVVALLLNTPLSLIMLAVIPFIVIIMLIFNYFIRKANKDANRELGRAGSVATEVIAGIKTVAALCAKLHFGKKYEQHLGEAERFAIKGGVIQSVLAGLVSMTFYLTYCYAFYVGTEQVLTNSGWINFIECFLADENDPECKVSGASVMCCIYGVILCVTFIGLMVPGLTTINLGRQAAVTIFQTIQRTPTIDPSSDKGTKMEALEGRLEFRDIFFTYPTQPDRPIFYDFNLSVKSGQSVALVGPSGSGKSTVARFLLRFYEPSSGKVMIDGTPLDELNVAWWRSKVGYVEQEPRLFPGTIRENIAFGCSMNPDACLESDIIDAAKAACAHEFIMDLPDGYDTYYGGTGVQLSGGQMQRIAIARAILRKPVLLVLDEATSALDSTSERHVTEAIANVRRMRKMTTVTIAHRLSTIVESDIIAVLDKGKVQELGDHKTLYKKGGIYTLLCQTQGIGADFSAASVDKTIELAEEKSKTAVAGSTSDVELGVEQPIGAAKEDKEAKFETVEVSLTPMSKIWHILGSRDIMFAAMGIFGSIIVGALSPAEAILTANIVNNFYTVDEDDLLEENLKWILPFAYAFASAALIGNVFVGAGLSRSGNRLGNNFRKLAFAGILKRSMGWFDDQEHTVGELTTILGADAESTMRLTGWQLGYRVRVFSSIGTGIIISLLFSWQIGLTALACFPFIMLASVVQAFALRRRYVAEAEGLTPPTILEQGLRGITSVQAYNLEPKVSNDYNTALEPESKSKVKQGAMAGLVYGFTQGVVFLSFGIIFYVGTQLLVSVKINFLQFFAALLSVMFGAIGASQVSADFSAQQEGRASAARLLSVTEGPEDDPENTKGSENTLSGLEGSVSFEHGQFSYPTRPDNMIFYPSPTNNNDGLNLSVNAKESLGLVGRSGSGKSTVLQMVLRFYDLTAGTCKLDGTTDVQDLNIKWLRQQIGYVGQMPTLFTGTVRENILLGKPDATDEEMISAAKAAHAHDFVSSLSNGYDTDIGTGGGNLSGGQKQRIAIARAIIRNPAIMVLDEATAALDNESEAKVQAALDSLQETQPRTTLVVAHRLLTVKNCTNIAFLGDGGVLEIGSFDELLSKKGEFYKIWKMQGAEEELKKER